MLGSRYPNKTGQLVTTVDPCGGTPDSYPGGSDGDARVDRRWMCVMDVRNADQVDRVVSVVVVVVFGESSVSNRMVTTTVAGIVWSTVPELSGGWEDWVVTVMAVDSFDRLPGY